MVKAKDFLKYLCEDLDYRFFAGVACPGLVPLYKAMNPDFMHYVPAVNERVGLSIVSGANLAGLKGGLLLDMRFAYDLTSLFTFNMNHKIPLVIIGYGDKTSVLPYDFPRTVITGGDFKKKVSTVIKQIEKESVPGLIVLGGVV
jgi:sulfopyruvate decarboxylase TPP-binding subunit